MYRPPGEPGVLRRFIEEETDEGKDAVLLAVSPNRLAVLVRRLPDVS